MTLEVRLRPEAEQDLSDAAAWYEEQRVGLGQEFLDKGSNNAFHHRRYPADAPIRSSEYKTRCRSSLSFQRLLPGRGRDNRRHRDNAW